MHDAGVPEDPLHQKKQGTRPKAMSLISQLKPARLASPPRKPHESRPTSPLQQKERGRAHIARGTDTIAQGRNSPARGSSPLQERRNSPLLLPFQSKVPKHHSLDSNKAKHKVDASDEERDEVGTLYTKT